MTRPSFDHVAYAIAGLIAERSTCPRLHTACVITTQSNRIVCTGYNGSLPGTPHCDDKRYCGYCTGGIKKVYETRPGPPLYFYEPPLKVIAEEVCGHCDGNFISEIGCLIIDGHCKRTVHAEANAITQAAHDGISVAGCKAYILHRPCIDCTKLLISSGITEIRFGSSYRDDDVTQYLKEINWRGIYLAGEAWLGSYAPSSPTLIEDL